MAWNEGLTGQKVLKDRGVPNFLVSHELDQILVRGGQASIFEVLRRESGKPVVEEVELDELLMEAKIE